MEAGRRTRRWEHLEQKSENAQSGRPSESIYAVVHLLVMHEQAHDGLLPAAVCRKKGRI